MDESTRLFVQENLHADTTRLLLQSERYPHIDMRAVVQQIEGLRTAAEKWPSLLSYPHYIFPPHLNCEQSSSDITARYKTELFVPLGTQVADLTGGMGIDTLWMAQRAAHVTYIERDKQLCELMQYNVHALDIRNITCLCADSIEWLQQQKQNFDIIYIDPARRKQGKRTHAFEDCTPNILEHIDLLQSYSTVLMVKASPMIDLRLAIKQLNTVSDAHIVAVHGECKEVLLVCRPQTTTTTIHCINLQSDNDHAFTFRLEEEQQAAAHYCSEVGTFLYEPHAALMKGGAHKLLAQHYDMAQLDANSHLYTNNTWCKEFPGRVFRIIQPVKLSRSTIKKVVPENRLHVVTRNYPIAATELQQKLGLHEGGNRYLIATTVAGKKSGFLCERIDC